MLPSRYDEIRKTGKSYRMIRAVTVSSSQTVTGGMQSVSPDLAHTWHVTLVSQDVQVEKRQLTEVVTDIVYVYEEMDLLYHLNLEQNLFLVLSIYCYKKFWNPKSRIRIKTPPSS